MGKKRNLGSGAACWAVRPRTVVHCNGGNVGRYEYGELHQSRGIWVGLRGLGGVDLVWPENHRQGTDRGGRDEGGRGICCHWPIIIQISRHIRSLLHSSSPSHLDSSVEPGTKLMPILPFPGTYLERMISGTGTPVCCFTSSRATSSPYRTRSPDLKTRLLSWQVTWPPGCRLRKRTSPSLSSPPVSRQCVSTEYPSSVRQSAYPNPTLGTTQIRVRQRHNANPISSGHFMIACLLSCCHR